MDRQAILLGMIRWFSREFAGRLPTFSPMRVCLSAAETLARTAPAAAEAMLGPVFASPVVAGFLAASGTDFDAVSEAFRSAVRQNEKMVVSLGGIPYSLTETDIQNIASSIRQAAQELGVAQPKAGG